MKRSKLSSVFMVITAATLLNMTGCATSKTNTKYESKIANLVSDDTKRDWNFRPTWVSSPDPDDSEKLYCYAEIEGARNYITLNVNKYKDTHRANVYRHGIITKESLSPVFIYNKIDTPKYEKLVLNEIVGCIDKKLGFHDALIAKHSVSTLKRFMNTSDFWFDKDYAYMKIILDIEMLRKEMAFLRKLNNRYESSCDHCWWGTGKEEHLKIHNKLAKMPSGNVLYLQHEMKKHFFSNPWLKKPISSEKMINILNDKEYIGEISPSDWQAWNYMFDKIIPYHVGRGINYE